MLHEQSRQMTRAHPQHLSEVFDAVLVQKSGIAEGQTARDRCA
jgi:hypothetical protein